MFDRWAADYDRSVQEIAAAESYPFAGYDAVIDAVCAECSDGMRVLDLGVGTGALGVRLGHCRVWGVDISPAMLDAARVKLPAATLVEADLLATWPDSLDGPFDRIISAYVLHEFDLEGKTTILRRARDRLAPGGRIVVGDVTFFDRSALEAARARWRDRWDESEHYWTADEAIAALAGIGIEGTWRKISSCAGVLSFKSASA